MMVRTYRPPESSSSGGQQAGAMEVGAETEPSEGRGHFSPGSGRCGWGLGRAVGRVGARGCAVPTGAGDVESHALCPGAVARQRGCPHPGRVVPGGQQGQVDAPKLGISEAGHTQHCGLLRATQNSWLGGGCGRQVGLAPGEGGVFQGTYLPQAAVLDFILEDEAIGVRRLKPAQEDTALAGRLPGHLPWDTIGLSCGRGRQAAQPQAPSHAAM